MADKLIKFEVAVRESQLEYFRAKNPEDEIGDADFATLLEAGMVLNVNSVRQIEDKPADPEAPEWTPHETSYALMMASAPQGKQWAAFAGRVLLLGIQDGWTVEDILEYTFESFHSLGLEEIPKNQKEILRDMRLYRLNK